MTDELFKTQSELTEKLKCIEVELGNILKDESNINLELKSIDKLVSDKAKLELRINDNKSKRMELLLNPIKYVSSDELMSKRSELTSKIESYDKEYSDTYLKLMELKSKRNGITDKITELKSKPDVCPTCNQKWIHHDNDHSKLSELNNQVLECDKEIEKLDKKVNSLSFDKYELKVKLSELDEELLNIHKTNELAISNESKLKSINDSLVEDLLALSSINIPNSDELNGKLEVLKTNKTNLLNTQNSINDELINIKSLLIRAVESNSVYHKRQDSIKEMDELKLNIESINSDKSKLTNQMMELDKFASSVLSDKGLLVATLLQQVADKMNTDDQLQVITTEKLNNGKLKPNLNLKLFIPQFNDYIDYDKLSGGNKLMADLRFLKCITELLGNIGILFMDEVFKFFDDDNIINASGIIKEFRTNSVFLILHGEQESAISHSIIHTELTEDGTKYKLIS